jgi:uncharacterized protein (TIRG00374 family)
MSTPRRPRRWHTVVILLLTAGLFWLFLRNVNLAETWRAVTRADLRYIAAAVGVTLVTYVLRALRWQAILRPIGHARFRTVLRTTVIGFAATFLLPGRVGEILRPYLVARHEGMKVSATIATVIVERLLDVVTVLVFFALSLPLLGVEVSPEIQAAGIAAGAGAVSALIILAFLAGHPERLGRWASLLARWLPERAAGAVGHIVQTFVEGLVVMRRPSDLLRATLWSVPVWLSISISILLASHAFDLRLSLAGAFFVMGYLAVGVSVPTPGGAGGFHYFYLLALTQFFGADRDVAAAAAIILHAVSFVPVTLIGLVVMWQDGLTLGSLQGMRREAQAAEP